MSISCGNKITIHFQLHLPPLTSRSWYRILVICVSIISRSNSFSQSTFVTPEISPTGTPIPVKKNNNISTVNCNRRINLLHTTTTLLPTFGKRFIATNQDRLVRSLPYNAMAPTRFSNIPWSGRFPDDGEHNIFVPSAVRTWPEDGHAAARRRCHRREANQTDRQVRRFHFG